MAVSFTKMDEIPVDLTSVKKQTKNPPERCASERIRFLYSFHG